MALEGSLRDFGLADILQLIYFQKKTGMLVLSGEADRVHLLFHEGNVISVESKRRAEENRLGKILMKKGLINEEDLRSSLEEQRTTKARLGDILHKRGLLAREELRETLLSQMTETVVQLFSWKEGTYEFHSQGVALSEEIPLILDTQHLLMEGLRVLDEWSVVEGRISLDTVFRKTGKTEPSFTPEEEEILRFVDGESEVSIIVDLSGLDDHRASKVLVSLMERDIIEPMETVHPAVEVVTAIRPAMERPFAWFLYPVVFLIGLAVSLGAATLHGIWSQKGPAVFWAGDLLKGVKTAREIDALRFKADASRYKNGSYPTDLNQIGSAYDAWGRPYAYSYENETLVILSSGPDGEIGTSDDIY